eukprot:809998-Prorocentrum_minimum.AAC.2
MCCKRAPPPVDVSAAMVDVSAAMVDVSAVMPPTTHHVASFPSNEREPDTRATAVALAARKQAKSASLYTPSTPPLHPLYTPSRPQTSETCRPLSSIPPPLVRSSHPVGSPSARCICPL